MLMTFLLKGMESPVAHNTYWLLISTARLSTWNHFRLFGFQNKRDKYHKTTGPAWRVRRGMVPHTTISQHTTALSVCPTLPTLGSGYFAPPHRHTARAALKGCCVCTRSSGPLIPHLTNICVLLCRMWDFYHILSILDICGNTGQHTPPCYDPP